MSEQRLREILAAHAEKLAGRPSPMQELDVTIEERRQLAPLFRLAERLDDQMTPVKPPSVFVRSLGQELVKNAHRQVALTQRMSRGVLIGAAAVGSLLSIASLVGAIVFVVSRLRARGQARTAHIPTAS